MNNTLNFSLLAQIASPAVRNSPLLCRLHDFIYSIAPTAYIIFIFRLYLVYHIIGIISTRFCDCLNLYQIYIIPNIT